jgi:hypothetical protein
VGNIKNIIFSHLTTIQNFILRELKKEQIYKSRGPQAIHEFILV